MNMYELLLWRRLASYETCLSLGYSVLDIKNQHAQQIHPQMLNGAGIFTYNWPKFMVHVDK